MDFSTLTFYVFAAILVFAALRVITTRNPVHAALWLVLCFFTAAAVWLLLRAEFLAIALVLVYVGAVMVLFLFVVMMLDVNFDNLRKNFRSYIIRPAGSASAHRTRSASSIDGIGYQGPVVGLAAPASTTRRTSSIVFNPGGSVPPHSNRVMSGVQWNSTTRRVRAEPAPRS